MKYPKLLVMVVFVVAIISGIVFATHSFEVTSERPCACVPSQVEKHPQPPENVTVIPELEPVSFDLSLDTNKITVRKGQSVDITVAVHSTEKANLLLTVGTEDYLPSLALMGLQPELPLGITASLDRTEISVKVGHQTTVILTLSIKSQAKSGIYTLQIFAVQKTRHGIASVGIPLQLTIS